MIARMGSNLAAQYANPGGRKLAAAQHAFFTGDQLHLLAQDAVLLRNRQ